MPQEFAKARRAKERNKRSHKISRAHRTPDLNEILTGSLGGQLEDAEEGGGYDVLKPSWGLDIPRVGLPSLYSKMKERITRYNTPGFISLSKMDEDGMLRSRSRVYREPVRTKTKFPSLNASPKLHWQGWGSVVRLLFSGEFSCSSCRVH